MVAVRLKYDLHSNLLKFLLWSLCKWYVCNLQQKALSLIPRSISKYYSNEVDSLCWNQQYRLIQERALEGLSWQSARLNRNTQ
jgi:hypothetical protein